MMYEKKGDVVGETATLGEFGLRGVRMGSEGDPSELSEETEPERYLCAAVVSIGSGLWWGVLSVWLLPMVNECDEIARK